MRPAICLWFFMFGPSCADQTALMQDLKKPTKVHRKTRHSVATLMESATSLLKNGATPDVVDFTQATIAEVTNVVVPAIFNESATDQAAIYLGFDRFRQVLQALKRDNALIDGYNSDEYQASTKHKNCRDAEHIKCEAKRTCDKDLYDRWDKWTDEEEELKKIHDDIEPHFCDGPNGNGPNGTLHTFRVHSKTYMDRYIDRKPKVDDAIDAYNNLVPACDRNVTELDDKSIECNGDQTDLETKACTHANKIVDTLDKYIGDHNAADNDYENLTELILRKQEDRIQEYVALQTVNCILGRVRELNGRPCDEANGVDEELSHCQEEGLTVDYSNLTLHYPEAPPLAPNCRSRTEVWGACQPVIQPFPCGTDFTTQEYSNLPHVPEPAFSHTNPGCNAYPSCVACDPPPTRDLTSPGLVISIGVTVDGCPRTGELIPKVVHNSATNTASVRCCSQDGSTCETDKLHGDCAADFTVHEAIAHCALHGMRLCTETEMASNVCCTTGCGFDTHAVWVDGSTPAQAD